MSDEIDCGLDVSGRSGGRDTVCVAGIMVDRDKTNATLILVHWWIPNIAKTVELRYSPVYAVDVGNTDLVGAPVDTQNVLLRDHACAGSDRGSPHR